MFRIQKKRNKNQTNKKPANVFSYTQPGVTRCIARTSVWFSLQCIRDRYVSPTIRKWGYVCCFEMSSDLTLCHLPSSVTRSFICLGSWGLLPVLMRWGWGAHKVLCLRRRWQPPRLGPMSQRAPCCCHLCLTFPIILGLTVYWKYQLSIAVRQWEYLLWCTSRSHCGALEGILAVVLNWDDSVVHIKLPSRLARHAGIHIY